MELFNGKVKVESKADKIALHLMVIFALIQAGLFSYYFTLGFIEGMRGF